MTDQYPNIKRLGLEVITITRTGTSYVFADDLEKLLASAPVVYAGWHSHERGHSVTDAWSTTYWPIKNAQQSALLLGVQPIVKDSADSLLREFVKICTDNFPAATRLEELTDRARALINKQKGEG